MKQKMNFVNCKLQKLYSGEINNTPTLFINIHIKLVSELSTSYGPAKYDVNPLSAINIYHTRVGIYIFVQSLWKTGLFQQKR
jgi:hypothetical protein